MKLSKLLLGAIAIPLSAKQWHVVAYDNIKPNVVAFDSKENTMTIRVRDSNGVVASALEKTVTVTSFSAELNFNGNPKFQNTKWEEDSPFRLGLVSPGENKLGRLKRAFSKNWVIELFKLVPSGQGLDKVYFFNLTQKSGNVGQERIHPKSSLFSEHLAQFKSAEEKNTSFRFQLPHPIPTSALWISADGDDTQSQFDVTLKKLEIQTAEKAETKKP